MCSFIEQFNGQEGNIWISSWHLFFLNVCFSLPACSLSNIPYSSSTTFAFPCYFIFLLLGTSSFLLLLLLLFLSSFQMFLVKTIATFKILSSLACFFLPACSLSNIPYSSYTKFPFPCYFIFLLLGTSSFLLLLLLLFLSFFPNVLGENNKIFQNVQLFSINLIKCLNVYPDG